MLNPSPFNKKVVYKKMSLRHMNYCVLFLGFIPSVAFANVMHSGFEPVASVILWVTLIFLFGIIGRTIAERFHQAGVLGELLMGVLVGNICYYFGMPLAIILREGPSILNIMSNLLSGMPLIEAVNANIPNLNSAKEVALALSGASGINLIKVAYVVDIFSRYGIIFLLFMVGLESSVDELKHTGKESMKVAVIGVLVPIAFALMFMEIFVPDASFKVDLFVAATLSATSVGITARVLKELKKLRTREAQTILGAAMIDDILGLVILAIVSSIVISGIVNLWHVGQIILLSIAFFAGALWFGTWLLKKIIQCFQFLELWEAKLFISFIFVMLLAWLASTIQLATIIGAFAAGIIMHDDYFSTVKNHKNSLSIRDLVAPLEFILAPLFFMLIGIQVKLEIFFNEKVLFLAIGLIIAAILGKIISGLGANRRDDRILVGIGMIPRGEVGLVFASIGRKFGVLTDEIFAAIILMVIVSTVIAPPWLKARYAKKSSK